MFREIKQAVRRQYLQALGVRPDLDCTVTTCSSWGICPDGLGPQSVMYSFGIGVNIDLDRSLIQQFGLTVHAFDPTPLSTAWLKQQRVPPQFHHHEFGLAHYDGTLKFYAPRRRKSMDFTSVKYPDADEADCITAPVHRLHTIMRMLGHQQIDLLKIDIEGAEYEVIADLAREPVAARQLLLEFHHSHPAISYRQTADAIAALHGLGYRLFFLSETTREVSMLQCGAGQ